ncbi:MAG TPA: hypothetical protein DCL75_12420, partial [Ktedonobacter sp.]|nr:hypothetical protein [Ktedonobacter sp.]
MPFTVAVDVLTRAVELLGVVAAAVGVELLLLPVLVELPQAARAIVSKRIMVSGIVRLKYIMSFCFLLVSQDWS